jgi:hypothetical protein
MPTHPHAVPEDGAAGEWARGIDANHTDRLPALPNLVNEPVHERALARARRSGHPHQIGSAGSPVDPLDERLAFRRAILDE